MLFYVFPGSIVFLVTLWAFMRDATAPKHDLASWLVVFLASVLWPVSVFSILRHRWYRYRASAELVSNRHRPEPPVAYLNSLDII